MRSIKGKSENILSKITDIYIVLLLILFPLMVDKTGFFKILEHKYRCFVSISTAYICITTIIYMYLLSKKQIKLKKLTIIQKLSLIFLIINIVSTLASPYLKQYNLLIGEGRGEGLITSILYILTFLYISYFGKFKKKYILYFSISSILINLIAILQFIGFNPLNMYQDGIGTHNVSFMATIGNIDFISALYTILLSISFVSYILLEDNKKYENIIHLCSLFMGSFIIDIIDVSSGKLAFAITLLIILPQILQNNQSLSKFLKCIATILSSIMINIILNVEYHYNIGKLGFYFQFNYIVILFLLIIIIICILSKYIENKKYNIKNIKKFTQTYYKAGIILCILGLISIYIIPFKHGFLYEVHELLHLNFDDDFGTYRIFLWKRTIPLIKDYPLLGSGPDTFALRFMPLYSEDIAKIGPLTINDTAANIYLTMLINLGIIGTISYLSFLLTQIKIGVKKSNNYSKILLISIICYSIQSFFNLSVVIISPIFWTLMGIHHLSIEKGENYEEKRRK